MRFLVVLVLATAWQNLADAQAPQKPTLPATKLSLKATGAPDVPLRHHLLPDYHERTLGNAALSYYRAIVMLNQSFGNSSAKGNQQERQKERKKIDEILSGTSQPTDLAELRTYVRRYDRVLREVDIGVFRAECDWDLDRRIDAEGFGTLLPELQEMRELATLLRVRCRMYQLEGKTADALHDIERGFALARHVGEQSTFVQSLVGIAIAAIFAGELERTLEAADCPNLYWSLAALPRPFISMRTAWQGEVRGIDASLPILREIEKPMTVEQARQALESWVSSVESIESAFACLDVRALRSPLVLATFVAFRQPAARAALLKMGKTENQLDAMPAAQVVLLESILQYKRLRDELFVWFGAPYGEARQGLKQVSDRMRIMRESGIENIFLAGMLETLPAANNLLQASERIDRKLAALRTIEALRMHAAANSKKFPAKLADVTIVPLPDDPVTGRPFEYVLDTNGTALLLAPAVNGQPPSIRNALKYELTLVK